MINQKKLAIKKRKRKEGIKKQKKNQRNLLNLKKMSNTLMID